MSYKLDKQEIAQYGINTTGVSVGRSSDFPIISDFVTITGNLSNSVSLAISPGSPFDGFPILVTSNDEEITDYNLFIRALGQGTVSLGSVLALKGEGFDPDVVTLGGMFFSGGSGQVVMGCLVEDVPTWVPLPTSFEPPPSSSGVIIDDTSSPYTVLPEDDIISVGTGPGAVILNLPSTADVDSWKIYKVKDQSGNASTNNITVNADGSELIDGGASFVMSNPYEAITIYSNGTDWLVL